MFIKLSQWLQKYIASHKESFLSIIQKTELYQNDGNINEVHIQQTAQYHATMLRDFFSADAMQELHKNLQEYLAAQDWPAVTTLLCMHFFIVLERVPFSFLSLTADDQVFRCYAEELSNLIA